ncbi:hypothetical protein Tco_0716362 [Tanacetum coccineum]
MMNPPTHLNNTHIIVPSVEVRLVVNIVDNVLMSGVEEIIRMKFVLYAVMKLKNHSGKHCERCSCKWCGSGLGEGICFICASNNKNSSIGDPNPNSFNDSQNLSDYPSQPQYQTNSCELCGNDAHYGYDCSPQVPFVYNQDPCFNQNFENNFPQTSPCFPQQYLCCENCGGPHETFQCQPLNQNFYEPNLCYNFNSFGFDQFQPPQYPVNSQPPEESIEEFFVKHAQEMITTLQSAMKIVIQQHEQAVQKEEQAAFTPYWKFPIFNDDNDEYTI